MSPKKQSVRLRVEQEEAMQNAKRVRPGTINDILGTNLNGYQVVIGYYLKREHGLAGFFPAIIAATREMVICCDKRLIELVRAALPVRESKIEEVFLLVNKKGEFGFILNGIDAEGRESAHILSQNEFDRRIRGEENPFKWAPGLAGP